MKGLRLYLIGGSAVLLVYLVAQYYKPKPTDWTPTYLKEDKIPFGLYILHQEIHSLFPEAAVRISRQPLYNTLKEQANAAGNYLIVSGTIKMDENDYAALIRYLKKGNHIFIAAYDMGKLLTEKLKLQTGSDFNPVKQKSALINFVSPKMRRNKPYIFDRGTADRYFTEFDTSRVTVLGRNDKGDANFIRYTFGKGAMYILPNPQLFSNYNLRNTSGADYAAKALSYLPPAKILIWDENNTRGNVDDASLLRVIFRHDQLRWAYYTALLSILLFVFFEIKRRQRIIPVIVPPVNSSVEFANVVGRVYYQQRDNRDIARKKINYFLEFIRSHYRLKTTGLDDDFIQDVVNKSGVMEETVLQLIKTVRSIDKEDTVSDEQLIRLNRQAEQFYKQAQ